MRLARYGVVLAQLLGVALAAVTRPALAQDLGRVSATRKLSVAGIAIDPHRDEDVLGLSHVKFQGLIASELTTVGYRVAGNEGRLDKHDGAAPPLTLLGTVKEEICDSQSPAQCRVAIQWELQDQRGVVVYRTLTRAVEQAPTLDKQRRGLVVGSLRSLMARRRFALQLTDASATPKPTAQGALGFKACQRPSLALPQAERAAAAALVFVESGSNLQYGTIVSPDGLILTGASALDLEAPLRVRFSAEQTLPAELVVSDKANDVALLRTSAHTELTCLRVRETPIAVGDAVFGVSSELSEGRAISLNGSVVQRMSEDGAALVQVDTRIARGQGAPLLDAEGKLAAVISTAHPKAGGGLARGAEVTSALAALRIKPAAITDPRLTDTRSEAAPATTFVRDRDDPPFVLGHRYTYGTSVLAHRVRTAGKVTAGVGAFGVVATWIAARANAHDSPSAHNRVIVLNDLSWVLLGLGVVGFGSSYAIPEEHDVVAAGVQSARASRFVVSVAPGGLVLSGSL